jgi:hypothetical protein
MIRQSVSCEVKRFRILLYGKGNYKLHSLIREFERENEVGRRQRSWQFLPVLRILLRILSLESGVKTD